MVYLIMLPAGWFMAFKNYALLITANFYNNRCYRILISLPKSNNPKSYTAKCV